MHARSMTTPSSIAIIPDLSTSVESLISEIQHINRSSIDINDANSLEKLEIELHAKALKLADLISAMKLQEALNSDELNKAEQDLIKAHPKKMKNMGQRTVTIRMLGGTLVTIKATYYIKNLILSYERKKVFIQNYYYLAFTIEVHQRYALVPACSLQQLVHSKKLSD
jgi:hypothetical protein